MNLHYPLSRTRFSNGAAKVRIFFKPASVSEKIFKFFFGSRSGESNATVLSRTHSHPFLKWECKGTTFFNTSKSFSAHRENGQRRNHVPGDPMCWAPGTYEIVTILLKRINIYYYIINAALQACYDTLYYPLFNGRRSKIKTVYYICILILYIVRHG